MSTLPIHKYRPYPAIDLPNRQWPNQTITAAPRWCSVDLRDGNQALPIPMSVEEKLEFFGLLSRIGLKEIEIGFPSAADTEFRFARTLIEEQRVAEDVWLQVLVQCREHLLRRTYEAIDGAPRAIVHFYNSTNPLQRRVTFGLSQAQIKQIAIEAAQLCKTLARNVSHDTRIRYQYSPESFSDTELEFSLEVCEAVMEVIEPTPQDPIILNLPATVELFTPNLHADQIEWFARNLKRRDCALISLHTHNDRGTGTAATELGLLAGADRVEGTLFGNGERTGNLDIVTVALNLLTQGVDPGLDLSNLPEIRATYERCTRMSVPERHPYAGDLVFTAFSGSHQDAIKKGMDARDRDLATASDPAEVPWAVPYLPIDPRDIGRSYQAIIRINSQSGKGGVAYILERTYGIAMPKAMHPEFGAVATAEADAQNKELTEAEIRAIFTREYLERKAPLQLIRHRTEPSEDNPAQVNIRAEVSYQGQALTITGTGNGTISAFVDALNQQGWKDFRLLDYAQKAVGKGSKAEAAGFVCLERERDGRAFWGASLHSNTDFGSLLAVVSAYNRLHQDAVTA